MGRHTRRYTQALYTGVHQLTGLWTPQTVADIASQLRPAIRVCISALHDAHTTTKPVMHFSESIVVPSKAWLYVEHGGRGKAEQTAAPGLSWDRGVVHLPTPHLAHPIHNIMNSQEKHQGRLVWLEPAGATATLHAVQHTRKKQRLEARKS